MAARPAASILHVDLDAFYASVEQVLNPQLRGKPVLVGAGVVLAASYEARRFGISAPMGVKDALTLCPQAVVVPGSFENYLDYSKQVFEICERFTPFIEQISVDEAFLDVGGAVHLFGAPELIGEALRRAVRKETGLALSVGIATTKHLAKVASKVAKPDGMVVVPAGSELEFLHPLPVDALWGVGPVLTERLRQQGVITVGDLAQCQPARLEGWLGAGDARHLHALSWNRDPRSVDVVRRVGSVGAQSALGRGLTDDPSLSRVLVNLADRVGWRMRAKHRAGRTISLRVRFPGPKVFTRAMTLAVPVASTTAIHRASLSLLADARQGLEEIPVTLVGISVRKLETTAPIQLQIPFVEGDPTEGGSTSGLAHLDSDRSVDQVREKFGREAVARASKLMKDREAVPDGFRRLAERD